MSAGRTAVLGATRGLGRALARRLAERGDQLVVLGRDPDDLARTAEDLSQRSGGRPVGLAPCDLLDADSIAPALLRAETLMDGLDTVVVTAGVFATQEELEHDADATEQLLLVDLVRTIRFCEEARRRLLARGGGTLCVFSSVAGEKARRSMVLYGAAKAGLTRYLEGLDLRHADDGLHVVTVKPGFAHTSMTEGLEPPPFAAEADEIAEAVVAGLDRGRRVIYAPSIWRWILAVVRRLPRGVMRRAEF